jgi:hypothetical protein
MTELDMEDDDGLMKYWTEFFGRKKQFLPPSFDDNEIVAGPYPFSTNLLGVGFVPTFHKLDAIVVAANGERQLTQGGYIELPAGNYKLYYVDRQERYKVLPEVKTTTSDGAQVAISIGITFHVQDSLAVQDVRNPLDALFKGCEAALRHTIRTHRHDEIIGEDFDNPNIIVDDEIIEEVKLQVSLSAACKPFWLVYVDVLDRKGHDRLLSLREQQVVQERAGKKDVSKIRTQTEVAEEQLGLVAKQGKVIAQQAHNEAFRREILFGVEKMSIALKRFRESSGFQHEELLAYIESQNKVLQAMVKSPILLNGQHSDDLQLWIEKINDAQSHILQIINRTDLQDGEQNDDWDPTMIQLMLPRKRK